MPRGDGTGPPRGSGPGTGRRSGGRGQGQGRNQVFGNWKAIGRQGTRTGQESSFEGWSGPRRRMRLPHVRRKDATPGRDSLQRCELPAVRNEDGEGLKSESLHHKALESEFGRAPGRNLVV